MSLSKTADLLLTQLIGHFEQPFLAEAKGLDLRLAHFILPEPVRVLMGMAQAVELGLIILRPVEPGLAQVGGQRLGQRPQEGDVGLRIAVAVEERQEHMIGRFDTVAELIAGAAVILLTKKLALLCHEGRDLRLKGVLLALGADGLRYGLRDRAVSPDVAAVRIEQPAPGQDMQIKGRAVADRAVHPAGVIDPQIDRRRQGVELLPHRRPEFRAGHFLLIDLDKDLPTGEDFRVVKAVNPQDPAGVIFVEVFGVLAGFEDLPGAQDLHRRLEFVTCGTRRGRAAGDGCAGLSEARPNDRERAGKLRVQIVGPDAGFDECSGMGHRFPHIVCFPVNFAITILYIRASVHNNRLSKQAPLLSGITPKLDFCWWLYGIWPGFRAKERRPKSA